MSDLTSLPGVPTPNDAETTEAVRCVFCAAPIMVADDGSRWLHEVGDDWQEWCQRTRATPPEWLEAV